MVTRIVQHFPPVGPTYIQNSSDGALGDMWADAAKDGLADLPDEAAGLGQQGEQDLH